MRCQASFVLLVLLAAVSSFSGCSVSSAKSPDVLDSIKASLAEAGLKNVSVKQDRHKAVVTLSGQVRSEVERSEAESIARSAAAGEIVGNEIEVTSAGSKAASAEWDKGIEERLEAALMRLRLEKTVAYEVKAGVVTLKGMVDSSARRSDAQSVAEQVPNVQQVVNELQVANQKTASPR